MVDELAAVAARVRSSALTPEILDKVRLHALDAFGAMFAGAQTAEGIASRAPFLRMASATNRPLGLSGPACSAAVLSLSCRLTECDDIHLYSCTTPGSVVYAAALATTALTEVDAAAAAEAVVAGYEVMAALGVAANGAEVVYGDTWPTYLAAAMTSAVVAGKLMRLPEERLAGAMAIAASMTTGFSGRVAQDPTSRWVTLGCAVQNGLTAAAGAEAGLHGDHRILERMTQTFSAERLRNHLAVLGQSAIGRTSLKPYCAGRQSLGAIEAFLGLRNEHSIDLEAIERVCVMVPPQCRAMIDRSSRPKTKLELRGVRYQLAIAALYPDDLFDIDRRRLRTGDHNVCRLMDAVEVTDSKSFGEMYPRSWPGGVAVYVAGKAWERGIIHVHGDPERPLDWSDIEQKYRAISRHCVLAIPVGDLSAAARALDFGRSMAVLSEPNGLWH